MIYRILQAPLEYMPSFPTRENLTSAYEQQYNIPLIDFSEDRQIKATVIIPTAIMTKFI
jgi:hypothetical protein